MWDGNKMGLLMRGKWKEEGGWKGGNFNETSSIIIEFPNQWQIAVRRGYMPPYHEPVLEYFGMPRMWRIPAKRSLLSFIAAHIDIITLSIIFMHQSLKGLPIRITLCVCVCHPVPYIGQFRNFVSRSRIFCYGNLIPKVFKQQAIFRRHGIKRGENGKYAFSSYFLIFSIFRLFGSHPIM